jgi:Zn-dependent protease with chaperone function
MIPSHWLRSTILIVFLLTLAVTILWIATDLAPADRSTQSLIETVAGLFFLFVFNASAPLCARFLAPVASRDRVLQKRLADAAASLPDKYPVFLYDHPSQSATTVGLFQSHSRIYVTHSLVAGMSDDGIRGVLAHEHAHIRERHIFVIFSSACCFVLASHLVQDSSFFLVALLVFLTIRRYCEYRADAGGAAVAGDTPIVTMLKELKAFYPSKSWQRWFAFVNPYPTISMRIHAIQTGQKALV